MISNKSSDLEESLQRAIDLNHEGRRRAAISLLQRMSRTHPGSGKLWGYLGFLNKEEGREASAIRCFARAVKLAPHSEKASLGLFHSLWRAGRSSRAFDEMRRYVQAGEPREYLKLLRDMLGEINPGREVGGKENAPILVPDEIDEVEKIYLEVESGGGDLIPVTGPDKILELAHA